MWFPTPSVLTSRKPWRCSLVGVQCNKRHALFKPPEYQALLRGAGNQPKHLISTWQISEGSQHYTFLAFQKAPFQEGLGTEYFPRWW